MATKNAALRNKMSEDFGALWNGATLQIRQGSTVLVTFTLPNPAFGSPTDGKIALNGIPLSQTASAAGTADNAQLLSTGSTYQITGLSVGTSAAQVVLDNLSINNGQTVNLTKLEWTESATV